MQAKPNQSTQLFERAQRTLVGGVNSPVRAFQAIGGTPPFITSAKGALLYDVDGREYVDYVGSWGPMILGHAHPAVIAAIQTVAQKGSSFGAPCELEIRLAETVRQHMPSIEKIRMTSSGTEATMSAIRLARAYTHRNKFIKFNGCYHGHADAFLINAGSGALTLGSPSSPGVTQATINDTLCAEFNDLSSVQRWFDQYPNDIAAIIVEPIAGNMNMVQPTAEFLPGLRALADKYNALLIFDEVMTGFRVALGGAQARYQVTPDLTTLGKIIGGGMPVGAFGGKADIMNQLSPVGPVYQAGTLSGNPVAMAAGLATLNLLTQQTYSTLEQRAQQLITGLCKKAQDHGIPLTGTCAGGMFGLFFSELDLITGFEQIKSCNTHHFRQFFHLMLSNGFYFAPSSYEAGFISLAHTQQHIQDTLAASFE